MYTDKQKEFRRKNIKLWEDKLLEIFNGTIPSHKEWNQIFEICDILNKIGIESLNHMLYPDGGGLDIVGCNISSGQKNRIEILTNGKMPNICNPKNLIFDSIEGNPEWSYFILELNEIEPSGFYSDKKNIVEEVYEYNGHLEPYNEFPPNEYYRHIVRVINGSLLIIPKTCYYNNIHETYLGIHNKYHHVDFKKVMLQLKLSEGYAKFLNDIE